jgi:hypothetical protein
MKIRLKNAGCPTLVARFATGRVTELEDGRPARQNQNENGKWKTVRMVYSQHFAGRSITINIAAPSGVETTPTRRKPTFS